jgi:hypothetical protein
LQCDEVLFDSNRDNWKHGKSVLNERIIGKKQVIFLIEDEDGERFGYYLNTEVIFEEYDQWIETDEKSFHFNFQSNGRLKQPMKFEIKDLYWGYVLYEKSNYVLIEELPKYEYNLCTTRYVAENIANVIQTEDVQVYIQRYSQLSEVVTELDNSLKRLRERFVK